MRPPPVAETREQKGVAATRRLASAACRHADRAAVATGTVGRPVQKLVSTLIFANGKNADKSLCRSRSGSAQGLELNCLFKSRLRTGCNLKALVNLLGISAFKSRLRTGCNQHNGFYCEYRVSFKSRLRTGCNKSRRSAYTKTPNLQVASAHGLQRQNCTVS